jgi:DNA-binding IclR family transcriptional regulator
MVEDSAPVWSFLTNHAQVLVCIANDSGIRLRDIGYRVAITERAAHRIVTELAEAGYITRTRKGRRNSYTINAAATLPDPVAREQNVGQLLKLLAPKPR